MKKILFVLLLALLLPMMAASVTVAWDPNPVEEQVTSYTVHWGSETRTYTQSMQVLSGTQLTFDSGTFAPGTVTYIAVTANNAYGLTSDFSNEVILDLRGPEYVRPTAPILLEVTATVNTDGSVTVIVK